jgi:hypothetical protein
VDTVGGKLPQCRLTGAHKTDTAIEKQRGYTTEFHFASELFDRTISLKILSYPYHLSLRLAV